MTGRRRHHPPTSLPPTSSVFQSFTFAVSGHFVTRGPFSPPLGDTSQGPSARFLLWISILFVPSKHFSTFSPLTCLNFAATSSLLPFDSVLLSMRLSDTRKKNSVGALISIDVNSFQRIRSWNIVDFNKRGVFSMQCWVRNAIHTFDHSLTVGQTRRKTVPSLQLHFLLFPSTLIIRNVI